MSEKGIKQIRKEFQFSILHFQLIIILLSRERHDRFLVRTP